MVMAPPPARRFKSNDDDNDEDAKENYRLLQIPRRRSESDIQLCFQSRTRRAVAHQTVRDKTQIAMRQRSSLKLANNGSGQSRGRSTHHQSFQDVVSGLNLESPSLSGASSPSKRAIRRSMRQFPPLGFLTQAPSAEESNAVFAGQSAVAFSTMSKLWSTVYDQRQQIKMRRRAMAEMRLKLKAFRRKKIKADNAFHRTVRSYSASARVLPQELYTSLIDSVQNLQSEYNSAENDYETLEMEMGQLEARLEKSEMHFFDRLFGSQQDISQAHLMDQAMPAQIGLNATLDSSISLRGEIEDRQSPAARPDTGAYDMTQETGHHFLTPLDLSLLGISGERPNDVHPLYRELLSALGDRNMAKESLSELTMQRDSISSNLETRILLDRSHSGGLFISHEELESLKTGLSSQSNDSYAVNVFSQYLDEDDLEFLQQFRDLWLEATAEIEAQTKRVDTLLAACHKAGAMPKNLSLNPEHALFGQDDSSQSETMESFIMADMPPPGTVDATLLANPDFPILLSCPKHVLEREPVTAKMALKRAMNLPENYPGRTQRVEECVKEYGILTTLMRVLPENKSDFINRWLLQILRTSPLAADLLLTYFTMELRVANRARWQEDVLYFWSVDEGNRSSSVFLGLVTSKS